MLSLLQVVQLEAHSNQVLSCKLFRMTSYCNQVPPIFALGRHPEIMIQIPQVFQAGGGGGHLFFTIKKLQIEYGDLIDHMQQFFKQKDYDTQGLTYLLLLRNIVGVTVS
jgi:hypothetical protein